jgi:SAM-dependent methyltransferase
MPTETHDLRLTHFSTGSADYAAHRPTYPHALVDELACISPGHRLALDVGCGTGQLSVLLADRFDHVIATDASAAQIDNAQRRDRVTYRTALAQDSGLPDASVDLITVAQAAHWLDLDVFYAEVRRIARPNAAIALITYGVLHIDGPAEQIVQHFYRDTLAPYWPAERRHVEDGYRSLPFPFHETQPPDLAITLSWTLDDLLGYIRTWSATKTATRALDPDPVARLAHELRTEWGDPDTRRGVTWPLSLRVGHVQPSNGTESRTR